MNRTREIAVKIDAAAQTYASYPLLRSVLIEAAEELVRLDIENRLMNKTIADDAMIIHGLEQQIQTPVT